MEFWDIPHAGCISSKVPACRDKRYGDGSQPVRMLNASAARAWALSSSDPESELGQFF